MGLRDAEEQRNSQQSSCPRESPPGPQARWPKIATTALGECGISVTWLREAAGRTGAGTRRASSRAAPVWPVPLRDGACSDAQAEPAQHVEMMGAG